MARLRDYGLYVVDRSLLLVAGAVVALLWANTAPAQYGQVAHALEFFVNDVGMVFFFALAAKEIVEARRPGGALSSASQATVPLLAAAAGMAVPAAIYIAGAVALGRPELVRGWAIPCATDIAFSYLTVRAIFPAGHAAIPFLLLLAVADDALGLVILALFYPSRAVAPLACAGLMLPALALAWWLRRRRVTTYWPYLVGAGALSWAALYLGGLHPALALVPIVPFMPADERYHELFDETAPRPTDTLNTFAAQWKVPVQLVLFLFGLANAGVPLHRLGAPTWLVFVALVAGKPLGIVAMTALAAAAGLRRPADMSYTDVAVVGIAAGIGFTVALFFATAAFDAGPLLDDMKMGALLSVAAAPLAVACSRYRRRDQRPA